MPQESRAKLLFQSSASPRVVVTPKAGGCARRRGASVSGMRALPLITEEEGKYVVCDEAVALLETIPAPVAVVSIAGLWRTGKSYLLNHFSGANCEGKGGG